MSQWFVNFLTLKNPPLERLHLYLFVSLADFVHLAVRGIIRPTPRKSLTAKGAKYSPSTRRKTGAPFPEIVALDFLS